MRFPLSTVETYFGSKGSREWVLYQFRMCPSHRSSFVSVSIVFEHRSSICSGVRYPRSQADTADINHIPMFVGEVRLAVSILKASWELSGGSQLCEGPTSASKYRHVSRATRRR